MRKNKKLKQHKNVNMNDNECDYPSSMQGSLGSVMVSNLDKQIYKSVVESH